MTRFMDTLVLDRVGFRYEENSVKILHDFSLSIPNPSITALLGLNGSGKTTLLMLLLGYFQPTSGSIYCAIAENHFSIEQLNGWVGYLPQRENIPFDYRINEFILLGCNNHIGFFGTPGESDLEKTDAAMRFMEIETLAKRRLSSVSGGELQRARIARLLVQDAGIILLDEPASHLDVKSKKQMLEMITRLKDLGKTIIYSTHDPLDALNFSDYAIMMKKGSQVKAGKSAEIITSASLHEYFETEMDIKEVDNQKIIMVRNGKPQ